ncbi:MAG TPA: glycosyltransferase [Candidatus Dormibacteraeota bacterium]|nr:glycosyltransferase [Candidatus Dormibacteraeota bacterium]
MAAASARAISEVPVEPIGLGRFQEVVSPAAYRHLAHTVVQARERFAGRTIWNVNSTARGGGVAEMLSSLVAYARGAGLDTRWVVIEGQQEFFRVTKRVHNQIQGYPGDGGELGEAEHGTYERALEPAASELAAAVRPGDVVLLHDPQTAGLTAEIKRAGAVVVWRCHVGMDSPNEIAVGAWRFLRPYLADADAYVFSRSTFAWDGFEHSKVRVIAPSIDPLTPKNSPLSAARASAILISAGIVEAYSASLPFYQRPNGSVGMVCDRADMLQLEPLRPADRFVTQVSRWDRLKDPVGVLNGFGEHVPNAHLVLAGPQPGAVDDDPEGAAVLKEVVDAWHALPEAVRRRVHLARLPMRDAEQNAAIVNALQSNAAVIVQKSLAEGFGLTVAEAMWKGRPVVASGIGGIQEQIEDGRSGVLLGDPTDLAAMGREITRLLAECERAATMGAAAQERVRRHFLSDRHLRQYAEMLSSFVA